MRKLLLLTSLLAVCGWQMGRAQIADGTPLLDLGFTADGIVNNAAAYTTTVGKNGDATTMQINGKWCGCVSYNTDSYFYALYNRGDALAKAFDEGCTWEILLRLDLLQNNTKFFSSQDGGGWTIFNGYGNATGWGIQYVYGDESESTSQTTTITTTSDATNKVLVTGKFYHVVVTMDKATNKIVFYLNGAKKKEGARGEGDFIFPNCGDVQSTDFAERGVNSWLCLGGDPGAAAVGTAKQGMTPCAVAFARIYKGALSETDATALYNNEVKTFTEPTRLDTDDKFLDVDFQNKTNTSAYAATTQFGETGSVTTALNPVQQRYEAQFDGNGSNFLKWNFAPHPALFHQMADAWSIEMYCQLDLSGSFRPFSYSGGNTPSAIHVNNKGTVAYKMHTYGYKGTGWGGEGWWWTPIGAVDKGYVHYVVVYDRLNGYNKIFINGKEITEIYDNNDQKTLRTTATSVLQNMYITGPQSEWFAIGGQIANYATYDAATSVTYAPKGNISLFRVWGKALNASEVKNLCVEAQRAHVTIGTTGFATLCLPSKAKLPAGLTAYAVSDMTGSTATLTEIATEGDILPYGTPVILQGAAGDYTLEAVPDAADADLATVGTNLLNGSLIATAVAEDEVYVLFDDGTGKAVLRKTEALTIPAGKAWLPAEDGGASAKTFVMGGLNAINTVKANNESEAQKYYNLQGQRVMQPQRGIYILNGKKVFVK